MKVKELQNGMIVWYGYLILGIKGSTLEEVYGNSLDEAEVTKVVGQNPYDYELVKVSIPDQNLKQKLDEELRAMDY